MVRFVALVLASSMSVCTINAFAAQATEVKAPSEIPVSLATPSTCILPTSSSSSSASISRVKLLPGRANGTVTNRTPQIPQVIRGTRALMKAHC